MFSMVGNTSLTTVDNLTILSCARAELIPNKDIPRLASGSWVTITKTAEKGTVFYTEKLPFWIMTVLQI